MAVSSTLVVVDPLLVVATADSQGQEDSQMPVLLACEFQGDSYVRVESPLCKAPQTKVDETRDLKCDACEYSFPVGSMVNTGSKD